MLSSTTFSPALFLSQMHATANTNTLLQGLDVLSQSIDQKSASLKVLVESNFERFVKAKATIDNVYKEMKYRGVDPVQSRQPSRHSRQASRTSFSRASGGGAASLGLNNPMALPASDNRKKNALVKESEYGVMGIKAPLLDVSAKAEDVWGPALGGREKEKHLRNVSAHLNEFKDYVEVSAIVSDSIKRKDYETLVESYNRARKFADETRQLSKELTGQSPTDKQLYRLIFAGRMWNDVDQQIQAFKKEVWRKLVSLHTSRSEGMGGRPQDQHMDLIGLLLELGVDDNPIWVWLLSKYDHLKSKIQSSAEVSKVEIEVLRRRLANNEKPAPQILASYLRTLGRQSIEGKISSSDSTDVIELWDKMLAFLTALISSQGILGELVEFWQTAQGFIDGKTQRSLPLGYDGESRDHHQLSTKAVRDLEEGMVELVDILRDHVYAFFVEMPPEDISLLFSPLPLSPNSPASAGGAGGSLTPTALRDPRFNFDPNNPPPPSPKRGESWEKLAFWPPWSNSISGVEYLSKMLSLIGSGASEMATFGPVASGDGHLVEQLKALVGVCRERCVTALCASWNRDAENIKFVEDWQRPTESGDVTRMPAIFAAFEGALLSGMLKILYMPEAMGKPGAESIVLPPPTKLLQMVRSQYVTTLYKALSGMVENAERSLKKNEDEWGLSQDTSPASVPTLVTGKSTLDAGDRVSRKLDSVRACTNEYATEHPYAPHPQQPPGPPLPSRAQPQLAVRKRLLRQTHRRVQNYPRRPRPNRRPPVPVLHQTIHREAPRHHICRSRQTRLDAPTKHASLRRKTLRLRGSPRPGPRAFPSVHHRTLAHFASPLVLAGANISAAPRCVPQTASVLSRSAHASYARCGVCRADTESLYHG
jgi:exocyst complex component 2